MAMIEKFPRTKAVDLNKLEAEVTASALPTRTAAAVPSDPLPDYVEHREGVSRVCALSAEAVVRDYEAAAKEIEAMGAELIGAAKKCEAMTADVHSAIAYMRDTATAYREEAKKIFKRIEECALFTEDVRKTCETVKRGMTEDRSVACSARRPHTEKGQRALELARGPPFSWPCGQGRPACRERPARSNCAQRISGRTDQ